MLVEIVSVLKRFRDKIYRIFPLRQDASMDLIDALSSNTSANSLVELSLNPLPRRNYCSITRVVDEFYTSTHPGKLQAQNKAITRVIGDFSLDKTA